MIPATATVRSTPLWQQELVLAVQRPADLLAELSLNPNLPVFAGLKDFPLRVPRGSVARVNNGDQHGARYPQVCRQAQGSPQTRGVVTTA